MPSIASQVELSLFAALAAPGSPVQRLDRGNTGEYTAEIMPAINVARLETANNYEAAGSDRDSLQVTATWGVFCYAANTAALTAADAVDALLVWVFGQLSGQTFGGLTRDLTVKGEKWNWDQKSGLDVVEVEVTVEAVFDIARGDSSRPYDVKGV